MSKIVVEDFNVCNKVVEKVRLMPCLEQKKYVDISHNVCCSDFVILYLMTTNMFILKLLFLIYFKRPPKVNFLGSVGKCTKFW